MLMLSIFLLLTLSRTLLLVLLLLQGFQGLVGIGRRLLGRWRIVGHQLKEKKANLCLICLYVHKRLDQNVNLDGLWLLGLFALLLGTLACPSSLSSGSP